VLFVGYGLFEYRTVILNQQRILSAEDAIANDQRIQVAEDKAISAVAAKIQSGADDSETVRIPTATRTLAGFVVAEPVTAGLYKTPNRLAGKSHHEAFKIMIYYDLKGKKLPDQLQQDLGTAYFGHIAFGPDGKPVLKTSKEAIAVDLPAAQVSRISHQEPVFAVVPANAQQASRVLPVADMASMVSVDIPLPPSKPDAPQ
jgi:hypothetical protein